MKKYLSFFKLRFSMGLQYRAAALAGLSTQLFFGLVFIFVYKAFFSSGAANTSMSLKQIITYLWLNQIFYSLICIWYRDEELIKTITNGNIAYELCRPQDLYLMWYTRILGTKLSNVTLRSIPLLLIVIFLPETIRISLPYSIGSFLLFIISMLLASLLISTLITLVYVLISYSVDEKGIINIYYSIAELLSGQIVPIPLCPTFLITISSFLPFMYISDFAFRIYTGNIIGFDIIKGLIIELSWLIIIILIGKLLTKKIIKRVVVQGG